MLAKHIIFTLCLTILTLLIHFIAILYKTIFANNFVNSK